jgi:hypothetical protein
MAGPSGWVYSGDIYALGTGNIYAAGTVYVGYPAVVAIGSDGTITGLTNVAILPTGALATSAALTVTGDSVFNDVQDWYAYGDSSSPAGIQIIQYGDPKALQMNFNGTSGEYASIGTPTSEFASIYISPNIASETAVALTVVGDVFQSDIIEIDTQASGGSTVWKMDYQGYHRL